MRAYLINTHLLVPRSRSSAKVKVKYKGYISQKMAVSGAFLFHKHILFVVCKCFQFGLPGLHSPTILKNILSHVLKIFLKKKIEAFECNTTSDWLNHMVKPFKSCVIFKFTNLGEKDKECS